MKHALLSRLRMVLLLSAIVLAYQNCGQTSIGTPTDPLGKGEHVIGDTGQFSKLVHDPLLELSAQDAQARGSERLELDLNTGALSFSSAVGSATCALDLDRLNVLRSLLASARACRPADLPAGTNVCMALSLADIELSGGGVEPLRLRVPACNYGVFLCDGQDEVLRAALDDLRANRPQTCQ